MPGMTGSEVLLALKADTRVRDIPVLFLTAMTDSKIEAEMLENGAADYIHKPFRATVLLRRIKMQLDLCSNRRHMEHLIDERTEEMRRDYERSQKRQALTAYMLALITETRDDSSSDHVNHITELTRVLMNNIDEYPKAARAVTPEQADYIIQTAKLHDIGKIGISEKVLQKPGKLTVDEFELIKTHPVIGARMLDLHMGELKDDLFFKTTRDIVLYHHEKWNGSGYPERLAGDAIPLSARVTAFADVYDAIRSVRPYKASHTREQAAKMIVNESGTHFDPGLVDIFMRHEKEFAALY
jgi:putative two-component system response regulator